MTCGFTRLRFLRRAQVDGFMQEIQTIANRLVNQAEKRRWKWLNTLAAATIFGNHS